MDRFFHSNPGMRSWIAHYIDFPDYTAEELLAIAKLMLAQLNYHFSEEAEAPFADYIERRMNLAHFANARSIRNALDRSRLRQEMFAARGKLKKTDLVTLEAESILASRVFKEGESDLDGDEGADEALS